jgi:hypothetical protein
MVWMRCETPIAAWGDLIGAANYALNEFGTPVPWFRGQGGVGWRLVPSVRRRGDRTYECGISNHFSRLAPLRHATCPTADDHAAWITLMQHYGLPTRLLDWTESILVACYFAVTQGAPGDDAAIWAIHPAELNRSQIGVARLSGLGTLEARVLADAAFSMAAAPTYTMAVSPSHTDLRTMLQHSQFTIHGSPEPLEKKDGADKWLIKFTVPGERRKILMRDLEVMGIHSASLFPDLEHLARHISQFSFVDLQADPIGEKATE